MKKFLRATSFPTLIALFLVGVVERQIVITPIPGIAGGNPFNQTLNTTSSPTFAGLSVGGDGEILFTNGTARLFPSNNSQTSILVRGSRSVSDGGGTFNGGSATLEGGSASDPDGNGGSVSIGGGSTFNTTGSAGSTTVSGGSTSFGGGTDKIAGGLSLSEGGGTGNAVGFGISFLTSTPGASGTGQQSVDTRGVMLGATFSWDGLIDTDDLTVTGATGTIKTSATAAQLVNFQAHDDNAATYRTFATLTNANVPTFNIAPPSGGTVALQATTYAAADGSAGVSVAACTAFEQGLCTAGTEANPLEARIAELEARVGSLEDYKTLYLAIGILTGGLIMGSRKRFA